MRITEREPPSEEIADAIMSRNGNSRPGETVRASYISSLERAARAVEIKDAERRAAENPLSWGQFRQRSIGRQGRRVEPKRGAE